VVRWGFPRRFGRFGWEPSQLLIGRSSGQSGGARVIPGFLLSVFLFPFGAPRRAPGRKGWSWWAPREPSRAGGLGRVAGAETAPLVAGGPGAGHGRLGAAQGRRGLAARGGGRGFPRGPFPAAGAGFPAQGHLRSFSAKRQDNKPRRFCVVCDTSPPRRGRVTRICRSPFSPRRRPRRAGAVFFSRRGAFSGAAPAPPAAAPGAFRGRAVRPAARAPARQTSPLCFGKVRPARSTFQLCFAEVRPPWSAFALCSGEVRPARSALPLCSAKVRAARFRASLWRSPTAVVGFCTLL